VNVLLTCVGRRDYLVEYFRTAVGPEGRIVGVNSERATTGMAAVDIACCVPQVDAADYVPTLLELCREYEIGLLVSLFDVDLPYIAAAREAFSEIGVHTAIGDPWAIDIANDKWKTFRFLTNHGIHCPTTFLTLAEAEEAVLARRIHYPLVVKPRCGFGSIAVSIVTDHDELTFCYRQVCRQVHDSLSMSRSDHPVVIQQFVKGQEFNVDVFNSLDGEHLATVVKRKLAMRAGETDMAMTVDDPSIEAVAARVGSLLRHRGNLDIDVIKSPRSEEPMVLEVNARFGGGYPFAHLAGADFPRALVMMASGQRPDASCFAHRAGVIGMKSLVPMVFDPRRIFLDRSAHHGLSERNDGVDTREEHS
jgi:carbamoyl-phosphate synthase large subunit